MNENTLFVSPLPDSQGVGGGVLVSVKQYLALFFFQKKDCEKKKEECERGFYICLSKSFWRCRHSHSKGYSSWLFLSFFFVLFKTYFFFHEKKKKVTALTNHYHVYRFLVLQYLRIFLAIIIAQKPSFFWLSFTKKERSATLPM